MDCKIHTEDWALAEEDGPEESDRSASMEKPLTRHQSSKSFSSLSHAFSELRSVSRRASLSIRRKSTLGPRPGNVPWEDDHSAEGKRPSTSYNMLSEPSYHSKTSGWLRRVASAGFRQKRDSSATLTPSPDRAPYAHSVTSPVPGSGLEPPILPYDPTRGAAARAAAAAQNEMLGVGRALVLRDDARLSEPKLARDSESGIGIDLRDRADDTPETTIAIVRKDPTQYLPAELITQILSYLDSTSLLHTELVSRKWHNAAISHHVWKHIFQGAYGTPSLPGKVKSTAANVGGAGLGMMRPDQDWKKMFHLRKALEKHWMKGQATAIYLEGHKDSVYCVQFDEHKIITGSRDQTIRIWDMHTFQCIGIIGALPKPHPNIKFIAPDDIDDDDSSIHIATSEYHRASILSLQFDDEILVTGSSDCTCIVWDIHNRYKPIYRLRCHTAGVLDVCFDDKHIVSCSKDTTLCLWDRRTGNLLKRLVGHRGPVNAVQLRGNLAVSASGDGIAKLWNLTSGLCIKEFPSKDRGLACIEFSEDARYIFTGGNDQVIYRFDANSGELINELKGHKGLVRSLHLDSANGRIISGSYDMSVKVFDFETGNLIIDFPGWTTSWMLSAKADYRRIVATSQDSRAVIMDFGYGLPSIEMLEGSELLAWMNDLLQLNLTKVEQCGTGAALCQIFDSIYMDVPMSRVKFNVNTEYGFLQNFKILQNCFTKHQIDRPIGVEGLIKCKMQDNLEFLQWTKRYWDQYYPGGDYDAVGRRKGSGPPPAAAPSAPVSRTSGAGAGAARRGTTPTTLAAGRIRTPQAGPNSAALIAENNQLKETIVGLERERDFYFSKLRDIELLLQQAVEADPEIEKDNDGLIKHVQAVLYSTEEGFEIPAEVEGGPQEDLETF